MGRNGMMIVKQLGLPHAPALQCALLAKRWDDVAGKVVRETSTHEASFFFPG